MDNVTVYVEQESGVIQFGDGIGFTSLKVTNHHITCTSAQADMLVNAGIATRITSSASTRLKRASKEEEDKEQ